MYVYTIFDIYPKKTMVKNEEYWKIKDADYKKCKELEIPPSKKKKRRSKDLMCCKKN